MRNGIQRSVYCSVYSNVTMKKDTLLIVKVYAVLLVLGMVLGALLYGINASI